MIAKSRKASIEAEKADNARIKIFTDGSACEGGVGASAVMYETNQEGFTARKYHLGSEQDHTSYEADSELAGALMAVHLAAKTPPNSTVSIYVDNQSTLKAIISPPAGPAAHFIEALNESMKLITLKRPVLAKRITFHWISSHSGVEGNEAADRLAKEAAAGDSSPTHLLPDLLTKPLPRSATAIRADHRKAIAVEWTRILDKSPRRDRLRAIDPTFHPAKFHKLVSDMRRGHSSLINQLRSNHIALNFYLHRIKKHDNPMCEHCPAERETVRHFLFDCHAHRGARHNALDPLGRNSRSAAFLLSTQIGTKAVQRYVAGTGRFAERGGVG